MLNIDINVPINVPMLRINPSEKSWKKSESWFGKSENLLF